MTVAVTSIIALDPAKGISNACFVLGDKIGDLAVVCLDVNTDSVVRTQGDEVVSLTHPSCRSVSNPTPAAREWGCC